MSRRPVVVVVTGMAIVFLTMGVRQSMGLFLKPVTAELGSNRESFALAVAAHNLILGLPLAAMVADRLGPRRVVAGGGLLLGAGLLGAGKAEEMLLFGISFSALIGLATSATSFVVVIAAVGKAVPASHQARAFGLVTAGASVGMFALVPVTQVLIDRAGWRHALTILGIASIALITLTSRLLPADDRSGLDTHAATEGIRDAVSRAFRNRSYVLLTSGFFVCGFHVAFIAAHLPAYLTDEGLSESTAAIALSLVGLFNIGGSLVAGWLGDRYRRRTLLSGLYLARAIVMTAFLLTPVTTTSALMFGAVIGLLWLSTIPLTSGLVAALFGARYLGTLYGIVFLSHQIGAFFGVWLGGRIFDSTGGYGPVWVVAVGLGVAAALIHLPISVSTDRDPVLDPAVA